MDQDRLISKAIQTVDLTLRAVAENDSVDSGARSYLAQCSNLLNWVLRMIAASSDTGAAHDAELEALARAAGELLGAELPVAAAVSPPGAPAKMLEGADAAGRDAALLSAFAALAAGLGRAGEGAADGATLFRRFLAVEERAVGALDPGAVGEVVSSVGAYLDKVAGKAASSEASREVTAETLTRYLRRRFPEAPDIAASDVRMLPGGFAMDTFAFTIVGAAAHAGQVVMRKDLVTPKRGSAVDEFPILQLAWERGIAVPEPLWFERDRTWFDGAFIIVAYVAGRNDVSGWAGDRDACGRFADALARAMVQIHALRPADLGLTWNAGMTAADAQRRHMYWLLDHYRGAVSAANPRIEAAFGWLLANQPQTPGQPPALVHSGLGFHNLITDHGALRAILDWEYAHFGDPADDLAYVRQFVERLLPWPQFLARYQALGGGPYTEAQDRFYAVWRNVRNACGCAGARRLFVENDNPTLKLGSSITSGPRYELWALREIARNAGLRPDAQSSSR
jgi:aminoglycoside phosphotransferase (APT) family kinase protein